jgi:nitroreductase
MIERLKQISLIRKIYSKIKPILTIYPYYYDLVKYHKYSDSQSFKKNTEILGNIIKHYHVIEKGLTMPDTRLGFGQIKLIQLINECIIYYNRFGKNDSQFSHALNVIKEYENFHYKNDFKLNNETIEKINQLFILIPNVETSTQIEMKKSEYFSYTNASQYDLFSSSRHSIRNYSDEDISIEKIKNSLELAKKSPSACNRQGWRTHVYKDKNKINEILQIQGGNSGFGHLSNTLIIVTVELGVFAHSIERNQAFVDGGIYTMNLLYALHFNQIATCTLNCATNPKKDRKLHEICDISKSEVFIAMISCGIPPEEFKIASSPRYDISKTNKFHN